MIWLATSQRSHLEHGELQFEAASFRARDIAEYEETTVCHERLAANKSSEFHITTIHRDRKTVTG
jgi:hypothetical protein